MRESAKVDMNVGSAHLQLAISLLYIMKKMDGAIIVIWSINLRYVEWIRNRFYFKRNRYCNGSVQRLLKEDRKIYKIFLFLVKQKEKNI